MQCVVVAVDGALMPKSTDLPEDLKPLVRRNALQISDTTFDGDCQRLAAAIRLVLEKAAAEEQERLEAQRRDQEEKERLATKQRQHEEQERLAAEQREKECLEAEQREKERLDAERLEEQRLDAEQLEKELLDAQQREKARLEAHAGDSDAMYRLGELYEYGGTGVAQDYAKACEYYQKAADAGNSDAKNALSQLPSPKFWSTVKRIFKS
jgi:TPR repeat protein